MRDSGHGSDYSLHARAQPCDHVACLGLASGNLTEALNGVEDLFQGCGLQGHDGRIALGDTHGAPHLLVGDGADAAQLLGEDEVRGKLFQELLVKVVDAAAFVQGAADVPVNLRAGAAGVVDGAAGDAGLAGDRGGEIALVRDGDQLLLQAKGAGNLGRAGQEGTDSHGVSSVAGVRAW